jgi:hypothetical protein
MELTSRYFDSVITGLDRARVLGAVVALTLLAAAPARAQFNGENLLGDMGVKSGSKPEPGFYGSGVYYKHRTDTFKGPDGNRVTFDPSESGAQSLNAVVPLFTYVSRFKVATTAFWETHTKKDGTSGAIA